MNTTCNSALICQTRGRINVEKFLAQLHLLSTFASWRRYSSHPTLSQPLFKGQNFTSGIKTVSARRRHRNCGYTLSLQRSVFGFFGFLTTVSIGDAREQRNLAAGKNMREQVTASRRNSMRNQSDIIRTRVLVGETNCTNVICICSGAKFVNYLSNKQHVPHELCPIEISSLF